MTSLGEVTLSVVVDIDSHVDDPEKSDFDQSVVGSIEVMGDRFYITVGSVCFGIDRYTLDELFRRVAAEHPSAGGERYE